jgi:pyruvate dehydrogenase kinase 2/3/4
LAIRLAHRIQDLERVPLMSDMPSVKIVKELYIKSFLELVEFAGESFETQKVMTAAQEEEFAKLVENIYERHSSVLVQMARGAYEFRKHVAQGDHFEGRQTINSAKDTFAKMEETHAFLDRFYLCRIGIRVLIGQYLALRQPPVENYIGIICGKTSPYVTIDAETLTTSPRP